MSDNPTAHTNPAFSLRPLERRDTGSLFKTQCDPRTRRYFRHQTPPNYEEHCAWIERKLNDPDCTAYIIECESNLAGMVRLDRIESPHAQLAAEVSILLSPGFYGRGLALAALNAVRALHEEDFFAEVHPENLASQKLFERAGYRKLENNLYHLARDPQA